MPETIDSVLKEFSARIESLVRTQIQATVADQVRQALGSAADEVTRSLGGGGRRGGRAKARSIGNTSKPGRRSPEEVEAQVNQLLAFIQSNPGQRAEQLAEGSGVPSNQLSLLLKRLLADKRIKRKGVARGTTYTAA